MNKRERVFAALHHRDADIVPYELDFTLEAHRKAAAYYQTADVRRHIGNHVSSVMGDIYVATHKAIRPDIYQDHFGVVWNRTVDKDIGNVEGCLLPEPTLRNYRFPEVNEPFYREIFRKFIQANPDTFRFAAIGFSLFERAWTLRGMENLLMDMVENPAFVDELLERITAYNLGVIRIAMDYPFDGVHFGDDWGQQQGTIMGPALWRRFIKPHLKRLYDLPKSRGLFVSQHSCGDVRELFPDLIDIGMDVFNTFQPEIMDPAVMKRQFGSHLTFWGGISTQRVLPFKTPAEVRKNVRFMLETVGRGGGYICAPTHAIPCDVPIENMVAMIETLQNQQVDVER